MTDAPSLRPAQGFGTARAQRWILGAAIVVGMTYALRRLVEPAMSAPGIGGPVARIVGHGTPPPALARWTIAYGTGFTLLALLALPAPELAASLAALTVTGTLLANGRGVAADLRQLEGLPATAADVNAALRAHGAPATAGDLQRAGQTNIAAGRSPLAGVPGYGPTGTG